MAGRSGSARRTRALLAVGCVKRREAFFEGYWRDMEGQRLRRITREELREIWRLWTVHRDIREGWVRQ
jgi:hypothetical protein